MGRVKEFGMEIAHHVFDEGLDDPAVLDIMINYVRRSAVENEVKVPDLDQPGWLLNNIQEIRNNPKMWNVRYRWFTPVANFFNRVMNRK